MAWHHVEDQETVAPKYELLPWRDRFGAARVHIGKKATGANVTVTHAIWRCGNCRALAVTEAGTRPTGNCGKCGARG